MANLSPLTSQSPSKENDSIDDGLAQRKAAKSEDDFEDSLNVSISEHISEEIESNNNSSAVDDSIEKPALRFDQSMTEKKRKLFDFDDSDRSDAIDNEGIRMFSKFDAIHLDESLAGDNIAKHFLVEKPETSTHRSVNEPVDNRTTNITQHRTKCDELKIDDVKDDGAVKPSTTNVSTTSTSNVIDEMQQSKDSSNLTDLTHQSDSHKSVNNNKSNEKCDVILINDQEISIHSLKENLQRQRSRSDIIKSNQNTTSDFSDLQNEENAKDQRSIDELSINDVSERVESHSDDGEIEVDRSKSTSDKISNSKSDTVSETNNENSDENIKKCKPIEEENSLPELSIIEEVSADQEHSSSHQHPVECNFDKKNEVRKIIDDAVNKLPLDKENRLPIDELVSIGSKHLTSSQNSTTTDATVYTAFAKPYEPHTIPSNFLEECNINLIHMENKIQELHNMNAGKYSASFFDYPLISSSRRDSLRESLKDFPQSGRDSYSINTTSTEYRPFQTEYHLVSRNKISAFLLNSNGFMNEFLPIHALFSIQIQNIHFEIDKIFNSK